MDDWLDNLEQVAVIVICTRPTTAKMIEVAGRRLATLSAFGQLPGS